VCCLIQCTKGVVRLYERIRSTMSRQIKPTKSELEILNVLWQDGPSAVRTVHERLGKEAGYTTTLKLMQIMHEKGLLKRDATAKSHIYEAAVNKEQTQGQIVQRLIDNVFNGSAMSLVMQALGNHQSSQAELEMIREYLEQATATQKKKKA
jgi:BlaI family transcriptional regulator, penicillinase repressor